MTSQNRPWLVLIDLAQGVAGRGEPLNTLALAAKLLGSKLDEGQTIPEEMCESLLPGEGRSLFGIPSRTMEEAQKIAQKMRTLIGKHDIAKLDYRMQILRCRNAFGLYWMKSPEGLETAEVIQVLSEFPFTGFNDKSHDNEGIMEFHLDDLDAKVQKKASEFLIQLTHRWENWDAFYHHRLHAIDDTHKDPLFASSVMDLEERLRKATETPSVKKLRRA